MNDEDYMRLAIEEAKKSVAAGGAPIGAGIVFGAYKEDIQPNPYELSDYHAEEYAKKLTPANGGKIKIKGGVLREECARLMANIKNWTPVA